MTMDEWMIALLSLNLGLLLLLYMRIHRWDDGAAVRDVLHTGQRETSDSFRSLREELHNMQHQHQQTMLRMMRDLHDGQQSTGERLNERVAAMQSSQEQRLERLRQTLEQQMHELQASNERKLEQMRQTVDEQLQSTLEKRLGASFKLVSSQLEAVQHGIGSMKNLTEGVGDLKRMLTNVKARGTWGEVQLGAILEQVLTPEQYARNVKPRPKSAQIVEFAVRLPGQTDAHPVWLPVDAKFPQEDYLRLLDAAERADAAAVTQATTALIRAVQTAAKDIADKYIEPPHTTDFAIMFLPTEGLYAEVLRQPGMVENMQQQYRVVIAGPTTLSAILNSLQMGFRTLAIEQRSSEVWQTLAAVKAEFSKFGAVLDKVKKQLDTASNSLEQTGVRSRAMERRLRDVETLPNE
jgi:DNA recombination protein RmuC